MRKIIERYPRESYLQFEERVNIMLMCDIAQELISQRRFNEETAACDYIMNYNYFVEINIDRLFDVTILDKNEYNVITFKVKITSERWKSLYEAYSTVNEWIVDINDNCIINISDGNRLNIPCDCDLWQQDNDANNQRIINERLIRHIVSNNILARKSANKAL